jgi:hypothetical protein
MFLQSVRSSERGVFGDADNFEIEGDGPLGIVFRESGSGVAIRSVVRDTVAAESQGLLDGMLLLAVEDRDTAGMGYDATIELMCAPCPCAASSSLLSCPPHPRLVSADPVRPPTCDRSDQIWAERNCITLRLQPPPGAIEVYNFLESAGCGDRFEAFHDFGARTLIDLDFVEQEDFAELGLDAKQQARLAEAIAKRNGSCATPEVPAPAPAPAPAPTVLQTLHAASASTRLDGSVSSFLANAGCLSAKNIFYAYGVQTLDDLRFLNLSDLRTMGLTAAQQSSLIKALEDICPSTAAATLRAELPVLQVKPLKFTGAERPPSHPERSLSHLERPPSHPVTPTHEPAVDL